MVIRNWKEVKPTVGHESAIIWSIFRARDTKGKTEREAPLLGMLGFTLHRMQAGMAGDYHAHEGREQVYYFTEGKGKMKIDDEIFEVEKGDAVHLPPQCRHQLINDSDNWIEHLIVTAEVP